MSRGRIAIALTTGEREQLDRLARGRELPVARLAGEIVAAELARRQSTDAARGAAAGTGAQGDDVAQVDADIHAALTTPGVPLLLRAPDEPAAPAAYQALNFLVDISAWLADPRPPGQRPRPGRLASTPRGRLAQGSIAAALSRAGGADGRALHAGGASGPATTSDKQTLSDMAPQGDREDADGRG